MEQQPQPNKPDDKYTQRAEQRLKQANKFIWLMIPMIAFLIVGFIIGYYVSAHTIETKLLEKGVMPCQDMNGKVWLQTNVTTGVLGQPTNYNLSLQR